VELISEGTYQLTSGTSNSDSDTKENLKISLSKRAHSRENATGFWDGNQSSKIRKE